MDQCSVARHPISATGDLTNQPGHDLTLGIDNHSRFKQCSPAGGSVTSFPHLAFTGDGITDPHPLGPRQRSPRSPAPAQYRHHRETLCGTDSIAAETDGSTAH